MAPQYRFIRGFNRLRDVGPDQADSVTGASSPDRLRRGSSIAKDAVADQEPARDRDRHGVAVENPPGLAAALGVNVEVGLAVLVFGGGRLEA